MKNNDIFKPGTNVAVTLYKSINEKQLEMYLNSVKELIEKDPIMTKGPNVDIDIEMIDVHSEFDPVTYTYNIIMTGVVV